MLLIVLLLKKNCLHLFLYCDVVLILWVEMGIHYGLVSFNTMGCTHCYCNSTFSGLGELTRFLKMDFLAKA